MNTTRTIPPWLHNLYQVDHLNRVIEVLSKRERARDVARAQSRRQTESGSRSRTTKLVNAVVPSALTSSSTSASLEHYAVSVGSQPENVVFNRYARLEPYDRTRVVVGEGDHGELSRGERGEGRYINANWVRELNGGKWWVATQAPLPDSLHAFLSIILQPISRPPSILHAGTYSTKTTRVRTVVQLTPNVESGMRKAHSYFPSPGEAPRVFLAEPGHSAPELRVALLATKTHPEAHCVQSTVSITSYTEHGPAESAVFNHMLYGSWPDHGVPEEDEQESLLTFARLVDHVNRQDASDPTSPGSALDPDPPIMVGCSAGIGRTGSFIAICSLLRKNGFLPPPGPVSASAQSASLPDLPPSPLGKLPDDLAGDPIACEIDSLREQRPGMVQRKEQTILIYEILALAYAKHGQERPPQ